MALIEGVLEGTPSDVGGYSFSSSHWKVLFHGAYTILPFDVDVVPCTPFIHAVRHIRKYCGKPKKEEPVFSRGDTQDWFTIHYEEPSFAFSVESPDQNPDSYANNGVITCYPTIPRGISMEEYLHAASDLWKQMAFSAFGSDRYSEEKEGYRFHFGYSPFLIAGKSKEQDTDCVSGFSKSPKIKFCEKATSDPCTL